jgi:hypothetical protein
MVAARDTLQQAIAARHRVGIAQGILMARHRLSVDEAFDQLRRRSQYTNKKLRVVVDAVVGSVELIAHANRHPNGNQARPRTPDLGTTVGTGRLGVISEPSRVPRSPLPSQGPR